MYQELIVSALFFFDPYQQAVSFTFTHCTNKELIDRYDHDPWKGERIGKESKCRSQAGS